MSFLWTRAGDVIHSRCTLCSLVLASRLDRDIHAWQRAHDAMTCASYDDSTRHGPHHLRGRPRPGNCTSTGCVTRDTASCGRPDDNRRR